MNYAQILSERILALRKEKGMTQETLAEQLGLSFQAVSKWENGQSCPDIALLPVLAEIFHVSIDYLFGKENATQQPNPESPERPVVEPVFEYCKQLPWPDDQTLRGVVAWGHKILWKDKLRDKFFCFDTTKDDYTWLLRYSPLNATCKCSMQVEGNIHGNATAGVNIECGDIGGNATAGVNIESRKVGGNVTGIKVSINEK